jgi:hypothetical protein
MRRFEEVPIIQLCTKLSAMRQSEQMQILAEWLIRARESYRDDLEKIEDNPVCINILQGRIALVKDLLSLINPSNTTSAT